MKLADIDLLSIGNEVQLAGAIYAGRDRAYLCVFPDEALPEAVELLDMDLGDWQVFLRQADLIEVEVTSKEADGSVAKAIVRKSQRQIDQNVSWAVYRRDGYRCRYCGRVDAPLTVDHLILWEEGGPSVEANLVSSCKKCNRVRGNLQYADWLAHAYYQRASAQLDEATRLRNEALAATLESIQRVSRVRSR